MLLGRRFDFAVGAERFDHHFHDFVAFFDVSHFAAAEQDTDLDFVFMLQELLGLANLGANIFVTGFGSQADFLGLGVRLTGVLLFVLVVLVFAVIHDSANGGPFVGSDLDKIQAGIASPFERLFGGDNPQLLAVFADDPDG